MFTGIIEGKGRIIRIESRGHGKRLTVELPVHLTEVQLGDSINTNGVCLTVVQRKGPIIDFDLSEETTGKTVLGESKEGQWLNLERALRLSDRLGGHILTGHIDGTGVIAEKRKERDFVVLRVRVPQDILKYVVPKGSIALDGISLTVNQSSGEGVQVTLIPFTLEKTTLMDKRVGERVNVEADILGKYVEKLLGKEGRPSARMDDSFLREHGFIKGE